MLYGLFELKKTVEISKLTHSSDIVKKSKIFHVM